MSRRRSPPTKVARLAAILAIVVGTTAGCRSPTDRYDGYQVLFVPPFDVAPRSGAGPEDGILMQLLITSLAEKHRIFGSTSTEEGAWEDGAAVLRVEGTITRVLRNAGRQLRWTDFEEGGGGVRVDVRFVDQATGRIVGQRWIQGERKRSREGEADPAYADAALQVAHHLYWSKSDKPADRE